MVHRFYLLRALLFAAIPFVPAATVLAEGAVDKPAQQSKATKLVQAALQAELTGDATQRASLLAEARQTDPADADAHWQSGEILFDGQWRTTDQIAALLQLDERWQEYRACAKNPPTRRTTTTTSPAGVPAAV